VLDLQDILETRALSDAKEDIDIDALLPLLVGQPRFQPGKLFRGHTSADIIDPRAPLVLLNFRIIDMPAREMYRNNSVPQAGTYDAGGLRRFDLGINGQRDDEHHRDDDEKEQIASFHNSFLVVGLWFGKNEIMFESPIIKPELPYLKSIIS
jgi:hypothetical protein